MSHKEREAEVEPDDEDAKLRALQKRAALSALMAGMVHDTRNIMTGVLSFAQVGKRRSSEEIAKDLFGNIEEEALRCIEIFEHLLNAIRGEVDNGELKAVNVRDVVDSTVALVRGKARLKRVKVDVDVPPLLARATDTSLVQILLNLAINAIEATPEDGWLRITAAAEDGTVVLRFEDSGPGVEDADAERIFEAYYTTKGEQGTGVGLSTSRLLARALAGDLTLEPSAEGEGAIFCLRLPGAEEP